MPEQWLPVVGHEGLYEVSDTGRVRSLDRITRQRNRYAPHQRRYPGSELTPFIGKSGYLRVNLSAKGNRRQFPVHYLVAAAFHGPRPAGMQVCHFDCDHLNNHAENLRYDTPKGNVQDSIRLGRRHTPALKTHCVNRHEFTPENTGYCMRSNGKRRRYCRQCSSRIARRARKLAA